MPSSPWLIRGIDTVDPTYYTPGMAMGRRKNRARTPGLWIATNEWRYCMNTLWGWGRASWAGCGPDVRRGGHPEIDADHGIFGR